MITLTIEQAQQIEDVLWTLGQHTKLYYGEKHNTVIEANKAIATIRAAKAQEQSEQGPVTDAPFSNCKYQVCDLPGQCIGEGKCHHPLKNIELVKQAKQNPVAFKFVRYVDGKEMAEGVTIEREKTLDAAIKKAVALCPNRDKTVLVYAAPVHIKDLTDDEIDEIFDEYGSIPNTKAVRAAIAADRELNK